MRPARMMLLIPALAMQGCLPFAAGKPIVTASGAGCSGLIPSNWREGVAGAELPAGETVGDWIAFGDAQTGKLDQANGRTRDAITIVEKCEERDRRAVGRSKQGLMSRIFG